MAKKLSDEDDFEDDGEILDNIDDVEFKLSESGSHSDARRRLEQLKEEKELERLINGKYDDLF